LADRLPGWLGDSIGWVTGCLLAG